MNPIERQAWLAERRTGLGATDLASICGVGFRTPAQVYASKVDPAAEGDDAHPLMRIGLATEQLNADLYAARMDAEVLLPQYPVSRHPVHPWALASLDRTVFAGPLELKYTPFFNDSRWGEELTEQIPDAYLVQTQWQMFVSGGETTDVSVLSGTGEHRVYRVPRSEALIGLLLDAGRRFWVDHVAAQAPPPDDWCQRFAGHVADAVAAIDASVEPVLGPDAETAASEYARAKAVEKEAGAIADAAKEKLLGLMGPAAKASAGPFVLTRALVEGGKEVKYVTKPYVRFGIRGPKKPKGAS